VEQLPALATFARAAGRSAGTGSALAQVARAEAGRIRATLLDTAQAKAQRAAVLITAPLGLCFLPAFLVLGIAPVVVGLAGEVLANWWALCFREKKEKKEKAMTRSTPTRPALRPAQPLGRELRRRLRRLRRGDDGMSTVEYAIGTVAAAAFGALLYTVVTGDSILTALTGIVERALSVNFWWVRGRRPGGTGPAMA
jgi:hypothetical protein